MTEIQPITSPMTPQIASVEKETPKNDELVQAVEKNNDTAKICAYTALGTSFATLIPLSVLAVKTGKISKVAQNIGDGMKPIMEGAKSVTDNLTSASKAPQEIADAVKNKLNELMNVIKSDDFNALISKLKEKVSDADTGAIVDEFKTSIKTITERLANKADDVNMEAVNNIIKKFEDKLEGINSEELTAQIKEVINSIMTKAKGVEPDMSLQKVEEVLAEASVGKV